jgi:hypothetical protein
MATPLPAFRTTRSTAVFTRLASRSQRWNSHLRLGRSPVSTVAELRAIGAGERNPYQSRYVAEKGNAYRWHSQSTEVDDGDRSIRPDDVTVVQTGRWLKDDGSQLLSGEAVPASGLGEPGDYYLLTDEASILYGTLYERR